MSSMSYKKTKFLNKTLKFSCAVSKSLPGSPDIEKKVVHFADAEGKALAKVKTYVPSYDDLDALRKVFLNNPFPDGNKNITDEPDGKETKFLRLKGSSTKLSKKFMVSHVMETNNDFLSKCFDLDMTNVEEKLKRQAILLEDVIIIGRNIQGRILVRNIAFEKQVYVRYTFDDWKTVEELKANYIPNSNEGDQDRFMFSLTLPKHYKAVLFALRYCVLDDEYWDNNFGNDYKIADVSLPVT